MAEALSSRSASRRVKSLGMCWTMTMGTGKSAGMAGMTLASAFGPPVEVPMARTSMRALARSATATGCGGLGGRKGRLFVAESAAAKRFYFGKEIFLDAQHGDVEAA